MKQQKLKQQDGFLLLGLLLAIVIIGGWAYLYLNENSAENGKIDNAIVTPNEAQDIIKYAEDTVERAQKKDLNDFLKN